jgi:hypothetical protein
MDTSAGFSSSAMTIAPCGQMKLVAGVIGATAAVQLAVLAADLGFGIDNFDLLRDPNAVAGQPNYVGLISNLGIVLWMVGAVSALQAAAVLRARGGGGLGRLLAAGGAFAALMGVDDFLMLHETVATAGIPEPVVLLPHAVLLVLLCVHAFGMRRATPWLALVGCVTCLGLSFAVDMFSPAFGGEVFIEESFKLAAVALLSAYLAVTAHRALAWPAP